MSHNPDQNTSMSPTAEEANILSDGRVELQPCPFCGNTEGLYPSYRIKDRYTRPYMTLEEKPYAIDCVCCGYDFTPRDGMDVIAIWNRRSHPTPVLDELNGGMK